MIDWDATLDKCIVEEDYEGFITALKYCDVDSRNSAGESHLLLCCKPYAEETYDSTPKPIRLNMATRLMYKGADLNARDANGTTVLNYCIQNDRTHFVSFLVRYRADLCLESDGVTPLELAVLCKNKNVITTLVQNGANGADLTFPAGLMTAVVMRSLEMVAFLVGKGLNVNFRYTCDYTPVTRTIITISNDDNLREKMLQLLLAGGANPFLVDTRGRYPLIEATKTGNLKLVQLLLAEEEEVEPRYKFLVNKALHISVTLNHFAMFQFLVENQADLKSVDADSVCLLCRAVRADNFKVVKFILNKRQAIHTVEEIIEKFAAIAAAAKAAGSLSKIANLWWGFEGTIRRWSAVKK